MMYGERLRLRRKARGFTQGELAKVIGCSKHSIWCYEHLKHEPATRVGHAIAGVLGDF